MEFLQLLLSGLALGANYALIALGFVTIYRASQVFNFAHGEILTFGTFLMATLCSAGVPWLVALPVAMAGTGLLGALCEKTLLRPLVGRPVFVPIIVTLFIGAVLRTGIMIIWGTLPRQMPTPWDPMGSVNVGGANVMLSSLAAIGFGGAALGAYFILIRYTRLGVAMRAAASDQEAALALGIPVGRIFGASWFLAGMFAALAGVFMGAFPNQVDVNLGYVALRAFPAVIVGGLESAAGAVIAGLLLGVLEVLTQGYINAELGSFGQNFHAVLPYLVMVLFLVVRPYGIFGTVEVKRA